MEERGLLRGKGQAAKNILGNQFQRARLGPSEGIFPHFRVGEPENKCLAGFQNHYGPGTATWHSFLPFLNGTVFCRAPTVSALCDGGEGRGGVGGEIMCLFNSQVSRSRGASPTSKPDVDHKIGNLSPCCDWPPRVLGRGEYILHVGGL